MFLKLIVVLAYLAVAVQGACQWANNTPVVINNGALSIPSNVATITQSELADCVGIESVVIPASVTSIGDNAFYNIAALTSLTFADGSQLTSIGASAFRDTAITTVVIPASVTSIGDNAFYNNAALTSLTFEDGSTLTSIGGSAFRDTAITSVVIPASVTSIGYGAFNNIAALTSLTFENESELLTIGGHAFRFTAIASVVIPASVTSIGDQAFYNNAALTTITFEEDSALTSIGAGAFEGTNGNGNPLTCKCLYSDCPSGVTDYTDTGATELENCVRFDIPEETVILTSEVNVGVVVGIFISGIFVCSAIAYAFFTRKRESEQKAEVVLVQTTEEL